MIDGLSGFQVGFPGCAFGLFMRVRFPKLIKLNRFG